MDAGLLLGVSTQAAERPAVNASEIKTRRAHAPVNPAVAVWGGVPGFAGCPACVLPPSPKACGKH